MNTPTLKKKYCNTKLICFKKRLKEIHGISFDDFKKNYEYAGGDGNSTRYNQTKDLENQLKGEAKYASFRGITKKMMKTELKTEFCLCGETIKNHMYAQHKKDKSKIIVLGNICIKTYMGKQRHCEKCGKIHKNRLNNLCKDCRIIINNN